MIVRQGKTVAAIYRGSVPVKRVYRGEKLVFDASPGGLPKEYQAVEYVEFTGNQYVYFGHYPTQETKLEIKLLASQTRGVWQSNSGSSRSDNFTAYLGNSNNNCRFGNKTVSTSMSLNEPHVIQQSKDGFYIDGVRKGTYTGYSNFTSTQEFRIGYNTVYFDGYVYAFRLWENGALIRDCVSCYRISDGVAGFYDLVGGVFYVSDTRYDLVAGPEIGA